MKNGVRHARFQLMLTAGCVGLAWLTGCQSLQPTSFAPLEVRLETIPGGGAQHLTAINTSGQALHHYWVRIYIWNDQTLFFEGGQGANATRRFPAMTYTCTASGDRWDPNQIMRFKDFNIRDTEGTIFFPVSRLQIVGRCDEGRFREYWEVSPSGQLQLVSTNSHPAKP